MGDARFCRLVVDRGVALAGASGKEAASFVPCDVVDTVVFKDVVGAVRACKGAGVGTGLRGL